MLQNVRVAAFTVSELLGENQQGVTKVKPPTQFRVNIVDKYHEKKLKYKRHTHIYHANEYSVANMD